MFSNYASKDANFPHWPKSQSSSLMSFHVNLYLCHHHHPSKPDDGIPFNVRGRFLKIQETQTNP